MGCSQKRKSTRDDKINQDKKKRSSRRRLPNDEEVVNVNKENSENEEVNKNSGSEEDTEIANNRKRGRGSKWNSK